MKRVVVITAGIFILMLASNYSFAQIKKAVTTKKTVKTVVTKTTVKKPSAAELEEGKALLAKSDCLACHKVDMKVVGPAYIDVAKKYPASEANYNHLADKIIAGGSGVWGASSMTPHPQLAKADVKKMVQYILSLN